MKCPLCNKEYKGFRDPLSVREYKISGMCQECQDKTFSTELFNLEVGKDTVLLFARCPLRIRVNISAIGSLILIIRIPYQLAFDKPGTSPRIAASLSIMRDKPNLR